jgi:hypothetical protein
VIAEINSSDQELRVLSYPSGKTVSNRALIMLADVLRQRRSQIRTRWLEEQRRALAEETRRSERALDRYYAAFETGELDRKRFEARVAAIEARLDALREQDHSLAEQIAPQALPTPDVADLVNVANHLEDVIDAGERNRRKRFCACSSKKLRVDGRKEILPTYRVVTDTVCALPSSVEPAGIEPATSCMPCKRSPS